MFMHFYRVDFRKKHGSVKNCAFSEEGKKECSVYIYSFNEFREYDAAETNLFRQNLVYLSVNLISGTSKTRRIHLGTNARKATLTMDTFNATERIIELGRCNMRIKGNQPSVCRVLSLLQYMRPQK
ncbi:hypothetical protein NPIL_218951 [Nephila pilipes]|uniref:Uncharacterized protein n=1 Tax=Nephila pilipes TaxID=299642 RepID=A0A8X6Q0I3_NEPPI|nr:hypothetical protein NPIL_218951 [Nephila pilipes]